jgi:hypothetical protein
MNTADIIKRNKLVGLAFEDYWDRVKSMYAPQDKPYHGQRFHQRKGFIAGWNAACKILQKSAQNAEVSEQ